MNEKRCYVSSAELGGYLYAIGGFNGTERLKSAERYDPTTNQWSFINSMATIRSDACAVAFQGKIYAIGGFNGEEIHASVEIFDLAYGEWRFGPRLNIARSGVKAVIYHGKIYVIGGYDGNTRLKSIEILDPTKGNNWQIGPVMITPRTNFAVTTVDDKILVMGGFQGFVTGYTNLTEMFDEASNEWTSYIPLKGQRSALATVTLDYYAINYNELVKHP